VDSDEASLIMLPGKKYTPEEIVGILVKRAWLIVIPLVVATAAAIAVGERLPKKYRSDTLIMLVPQRIPDSYVKSAGSDTLEDRLATLQDQLLSRSRLERIILDLNLYGPLRQTRPMEDVVQRMRSDITVSTTENKGSKESTSFRIDYVSGNAKTAQKTTERLASLFIEENLRDRENVAEDTSQFLASQLQDARQRLVEQEKKLEEYRRRYSGQLPSQASANLQAIQNVQLQLQSLREATDRARERRLLVERQLADLQLPDPIAAALPPAPGQTGPVPETTTQRLEAARAQLRILEMRDKPTHPDVLMLQRSIRDLEAKQQAELKDGPIHDVAGEKVLTPAEAVRQKRMRDLKGQLDDLDHELADKQQQAKNLHDVIADYQGKLDAVPSRESDLVELTRDYVTLQTTYQSLLAKREDSKLVANLERRSIGEQFRVLDPARVPERPFSPNVLMITGGGAGAGLALGVLLIGFIEYRDGTLKDDNDVVRLCQLPVMALVPLMTTANERRTKWWRGALVNAAGVLVVLISAAVIALSVLRAWRA
jgi:polysaccharide chain length determinant protein (PEP-CTERM system associated)